VTQWGYYRRLHFDLDERAIIQLRDKSFDNLIITIVFKILHSKSNSFASSSGSATSSSQSTSTFIFKGLLWPSFKEV